MTAVRKEEARAVRVGLPSPDVVSRFLTELVGSADVVHEAGGRVFILAEVSAAILDDLCAASEHDGREPDAIEDADPAEDEEAARWTA